jgi:hypothetical protein
MGRSRKGGILFDRDWDDIEETVRLTLNQFPNQHLNFLEVGIASGTTGLTIIDELLGGRSFTYYAVDTCEHTLPLQPVYKKMNFIKGISFDENIVSQIPDNLNWIFIDGCHCEHCVYRDAISYIPKLKNNGIIAFHDACPAFQGVGQKYKLQEHDPSDGVQVLRAINKLDKTDLVELKRPAKHQTEGGVISFRKQVNIPMI